MTTMEQLAEAVSSVRPLVDVLDHPVRVAGPAAIAAPLNHVAARLGAPEFAVMAVMPGETGEELGTFERIVSDHLDLGRYDALPDTSSEEIDRIVAEVVSAGFDGLCPREQVLAPDGTPLRAYAAGDQSDPAVVIVAACGMPARLCEDWMRFLSADHHVLTWESRGLFDEGADFGGVPADVESQAGDLLAVMDHFGVRQAHLMCLCGGAVIGLAAAARDADRVSSLSLWHGDFELGPDGPKTHHQQNLKALMEMAATSPERAAAIHPVLCRTMLTTVPPGLAHLVVYPYATPELLFRYCRLNGSIMDTDVSPWLGAISRPALVVTSEDDDTAHPEGSRTVAGRLSDATLNVRPHGDHISLFEAKPELMELAIRFIDSHKPGVRQKVIG
ncbi:alpha/beta hydrolase [Streptosporangium subroseum]|uniref:alpha/beta fold hydrolase n=1 Tax=Streptosporangium subroseum TaxID=106412 RepID=UPI00343CE355